LSRYRQLDLFSKASPQEGEVESADPPADVVELASRVPSGVRLGTSSWSFPGWKGLVYRNAAPRAALAREGLGAYARHPLLRTVGLDRTFYAPIPAEEYARYAAAVPERFRFLVKAAQDCTFPTLSRKDQGTTPSRNPRFLDASFASEAVVGPAVEGLGRRLGTLLFQFPPLGDTELGDVPALVARLARFLRNLQKGPLYSVEIRNRSLLTPAYTEALSSAGAAHAFTVHPSMPSLETQAAVVGLERQPALVVRWMLGHGRGYEEARERYDPFDRLAAPDPPSRAAIASLARASLRLGREVLVVVNNKAEGSAPLSVVELARELSGRA